MIKDITEEKHNTAKKAVFSNANARIVLTFKILFIHIR